MQLNATDPASDVYCPTWGGGEGESVVQQAPNGRFPTFGGGGADTSNNASEFNMGCVLFCVSPSLFLAQFCSMFAGGSTCRLPPGRPQHPSQWT
jgi:hypothetical protein